MKNSIAKQNTIEALNIYHKAQTNKWEVRVTDGNIRIASWTDKFSSVLNSIFNPSRERTNWNEKAELAIQHKLFGEVSLFQEKIEVKPVTSLLKKIFLLDVKNPEPNFKSTLENSDLFKENENIKQLWDIKDKKIYGFVVEELMNTPSSDLRKARNVAEQTIYLIKEHSLPKLVALKAARNCCIAMENKYADNFKDALDLVKFSGELARKKKIEVSSESIELAYYTKKFMKEKNLTIDDAVLCAKSLNGIKAEKKIKTAAAIEVAANRLNKMKEFQKVTPHGLPLNIDGSTTEFNLDFSSEGEKTIINTLKKPQLENIDSNGVNDAFTRDSDRQTYNFKDKDGKKLLNQHSIEKISLRKNTALSQIEIDKLEEEEKKSTQIALIKELKHFSNNDEEIYYALSLLCDQGVGLSFNNALFTDFNPIKDSIHFWGIHPDKVANTNNLKTNSLITIQWVGNEKISVNFKRKEKINYISNQDMETIISLKNSDNDYEIESDYTVEYKIETLRDMTLRAKEILKNNPTSKELKQITLNPEVELIYANAVMRINPDWES